MLLVYRFTINVLKIQNCLKAIKATTVKRLHEYIGHTCRKQLLNTWCPLVDKLFFKQLSKNVIKIYIIVFLAPSFIKIYILSLLYSLGIKECQKYMVYLLFPNPFCIQYLKTQNQSDTIRWDVKLHNGPRIDPTLFGGSETSWNSLTAFEYLSTVADIMHERVRPGE